VLKFKIYLVVTFVLPYLCQINIKQIEIMKKLLLIVVLIGNVVVGQTLAKLDEKNGFKELSFGTSIKDCPQLKYVGIASDGYTKCYRRVDGIEKIGEYKASSIIYCFYKDKFDSVMVEIETVGNIKGILKIMQSEYGKGTSPFDGMIEWWGKNVTMSYNTYGNNATVFISTLAFTKEKSLDKKL